MEQGSLIDRFPELQTEIETLRRENAAFQEICEDYESVLATVRQLQQSDAAENRLLNDCRALQQDLTREALQILQKQFPHLDISDTEGGRGSEDSGQIKHSLET